MPRLRRLVQGDKIFFVTTNLRKGLAHFTAKERGLLCRAIDEVRRRRAFRLAGFVVMPNHIHLLLLPALDDSLSALMQNFKHTTAQAINAARRRRGALWQKGFFDRFMRTPKEFGKTLDYIHHNPVRKDLVGEPTEWRWSSAAAHAEQRSIIPVDFIELPAQAEIRLW